MSDLKPCPFCGGEAEIRTTYRELETHDVPIYSYVRCTKCFAQTYEFPYKNTDRTGTKPVDSAIEAWNRRIGEQKARWRNEKISCRGIL